MAKGTTILQTFNRGIISKLGLARVDLERTALSAEIQTNWMPRTLGSMMLRPGMEYIGTTRNNNKSRNVPFVFARDDTAIIEFTNQIMRVRVNDEVIERPSVSTSIQSSDFGSDTGWTDVDDGSSTSTITGGKLEMKGTGFARAGREQQVSVDSADQSTRHAIRITVDRGPVTLRIGSSSGEDDVYAETELSTGVHSLVFTPNVGTIYIRLSAVREYTAIVDSCEFESDGEMLLDTPWTEDDLDFIRHDQSADIIYLACKGHQQRKIERRGTESWSFVKYEPEDGPFRAINTSTINITPSDISGDISLSASRNLFNSGHVGSLWRIGSTRQVVQDNISGGGQFTQSIRVVGVTDSRQFNYSIVTTSSVDFKGTITIQRSIGQEGDWTDEVEFDGNADLDADGKASGTVTDELDNQIVYYRIGVKAGEHNDGAVDVELDYARGSIEGVVRITGFTDEQNVDAIVIRDLGSTLPTDIWWEGIWSDFRGWPMATSLFEGRLWFGGKTRVIGSESDAYENFDDDTEGDSAPIIRFIGQGPVDDVSWLIGLQRLLIGTEGSEWSAQSSSLDEPLTPANFNLKAPSTYGSAPVSPVKTDTEGYYVERSGVRLHKLVYDGRSLYDYQSSDIMQLVPELGFPGLKHLAAQRQPDTRIHCVRNDGNVAILINEPSEQVEGWILFETDGEVEDVFVLPGTDEDRVYYQVKRTINNSTVRYIEKWAKENEAQGGDLNKQADSFIVYDGSSTQTISGLDHLEGEEVVVWGDGRDRGKYTVSGGSITLDAEVEKAIVGLYYKSQYKSSKLAYFAQGGTAVNQRKTVSQMGFVLHNTHARGIRFGQSFDDMDHLPLVENGKEVDEDHIWEHYDEETITFPGKFDSDPRFCLEAEAPKPCTVLGAILSVVTNEKH